jgi:hypothetical protein
MVILAQNLMGDNQLENQSRRSFKPNDFKKELLGATIVKPIDRCQADRPLSSRSTVVKPIDRCQADRPLSSRSTIVKPIDHCQADRPLSSRSLKDVKWVL